MQQRAPTNQTVAQRLAFNSRPLLSDSSSLGHCYSSQATSKARSAFARSRMHGVGCNVQISSGASRWIFSHAKLVAALHFMEVGLYAVKHMNDVNTVLFSYPIVPCWLFMDEFSQKERYALESDKYFPIFCKLLFSLQDLLGVGRKWMFSMRDDKCSTYSLYPELHQEAKGVTNCSHHRGRACA